MARNKTSAIADHVISTADKRVADLLNVPSGFRDAAWANDVLLHFATDLGLSRSKSLVQALRPRLQKPWREIAQAIDTHSHASDDGKAASNSFFLRRTIWPVQRVWLQEAGSGRRGFESTERLFDLVDATVPGTSTAALIGLKVQYLSANEFVERATNSLLGRTEWARSWIADPLNPPLMEAITRGDKILPGFPMAVDVASSSHKGIVKMIGDRFRDPVAQRVAGALVEVISEIVLQTVDGEQQRVLAVVMNDLENGLLKKASHAIYTEVLERRLPYIPAIESDVKLLVAFATNTLVWAPARPAPEKTIDAPPVVAATARPAFLDSIDGHMLLRFKRDGSSAQLECAFYVDSAEGRVAQGPEFGPKKKRLNLANISVQYSAAHLRAGIAAVKDASQSIFWVDVGSSKYKNAGSLDPNILIAKAEMVLQANYPKLELPTLMYAGSQRPDPGLSETQGL